MNTEPKPFYEKYLKKPHKKPVPLQSAEKNRTASQSTDALNTAAANGPRRKKARSSAAKQPYTMGPPVFSELSPQAARILNRFPDILARVLPLDSKKRRQLPEHIRELFHELTDERGRRKNLYMNNPVKLSAYMHYYLWWNLVRLTKLLQNIDIHFEDTDAAADFGSGPLTFICALWIAQPALRKKRLTWYCVDISHKALALGEELFFALCAHTAQAEHEDAAPWQIKKITGAFGVPLKEKVRLVTEANMFNEIFWDSPFSLEEQTRKAQQTIAYYLQPDGAALLVEPGIPLAGAFISGIRSCFLENGFHMNAPCPHDGACPFPYRKAPEKPHSKPAEQAKSKQPSAAGKWCHFVFDTVGCPQNLLRLSQAANMAKERASLSFLYCTKKSPAQETGKKAAQNVSGVLPVRICSGSIRLADGAAGRYACSSVGFMLIKTPTPYNSPLQHADSGQHAASTSGQLVLLPRNKYQPHKRDKKTGAFIIEE